MKLLKLISFLFLIYFIRRFIQAYKVMKAVHDHNLRQQQAQQNQSQPTPRHTENTINAEYKVID